MLQRRSLTLEQLPDDVKELILSRLSTRDKAHLSSTCYLWYKMGKSPLPGPGRTTQNRYIRELQKKLNDLFAAIGNSDYELVSKIVFADPELLLEDRIMYQDPMVVLTAFQFAFNDQDRKMCDIIIRAFQRLSDYEGALLKQFHEVIQHCDTYLFQEMIVNLLPQDRFTSSYVIDLLILYFATINQYDLISSILSHDSLFMLSTSVTYDGNRDIFKGNIFKFALKNENVDLCRLIISHTNNRAAFGFNFILKDMFDSFVLDSASQQHPLSPSFIHHIQRLFFLDAVAKGELDAVKAMLEKDSSLLLGYELATDYSDRTLEGTGLQIAHGAGDVEMCDVLIEHFDKLENGRQLAIAQINELANSSQADVSPYDFEALMFLFIRHGGKGEAVEAALANFRNHFSPKKDEIIRRGAHFDLRSLIRALDIYATYVDQNTILIPVSDPPVYTARYGVYYEMTCAQQFWRKVIGYLETLLPACDAQTLAEGFNCVYSFKQNTKRSFRLSHYNDDERLSNHFYYPLNKFRDGQRLGKNCAIYSPTYSDDVTMGRGILRDECSAVHARHTARQLEKLYQSKQLGLSEIKENLSDPHYSRSAYPAPCYFL